MCRLNENDILKKTTNELQHIDCIKHAVIHTRYVIHIQQTIVKHSN